MYQQQTMHARLGLVLGALFLALTCAVFAPTTVQANADDSACWGQASAVFAKMGKMGEHSSSFSTPREGLRNLARSLYDLGILPDDTLQSLGAFVAAEYELSIAACM